MIMEGSWFQAIIERCKKEISCVCECAMSAIKQKTRPAQGAIRVLRNAVRAWGGVSDFPEKKRYEDRFNVISVTRGGESNFQ